jgi:uncharacterized membrane protein (GlpM family)
MMTLAQATKSAAIAVTISLLPAFALASAVTDGAGAAQGSLQGGSTFSVNTIIAVVTNTLIFIVGAISVIVLIIGGLRYVLSGGNATSVQGAKNTILYAIVGLAVSIAAYAIIQYVFQVLGVK